MDTGKDGTCTDDVADISGANRIKYFFAALRWLAQDTGSNTLLFQKECSADSLSLIHILPYNFSTVLVNEYFDDCAEDLAMELEARGIEFGYFNYVESDVKIIADVEQLKRVINNIVSNSEKYMDKEHGKINLRVKDVGDFVQIELEAVSYTHLFQSKSLYSRSRSEKYQMDTSETLDD